MKRVWVFLRIGKRERVIIPDRLIDEEIVRLTKRAPRTQAEKAFHAWLSEWRVRNNKER